MIDALLKDFKQNNLQCVFLREPERLQDTEGDIDIWCAQDQLSQTVQILQEHNWHVIGGRTFSNRHSTSHVVRFQKTATPATFELWSGDLRADAIFYCTEEEVSENSKEGNSIRFQTDTSLLNHLLLRPLLKRRPLAPYIKRVSKLDITAEQLSQWTEASRQRFGKSISEACEKALRGDNVRLGVFTLLKLILKQYGPTGFIKIISDKIKYSVQKVAYRPPLISFVGTDGSGKSTTAENLLQFIHQQGVRARLVYAGRSRNNSTLVSSARKVAFLLGIAKEVSKKEWETNTRPPENARNRQGCITIQWLALLTYFMEYHARYASMKLVSRFYKRVQVLDRGAWDIATMKGLGNIPVAFAKRCPNTDLTVFCFASPELIRSRKQERSVSEIIRHQAVLKHLTATTKKECAYLNTVIPEHALNKVISQRMTIVLALRKGELDRATELLLGSMPLTLWHTNKYRSS